MFRLQLEHKDVFGVTFEQGSNNLKISTELFNGTSFPKIRRCRQGAKIDLLIALIALKYTQSNSVCYVKDGQAIGVGAGQQSRVHCTRLAGNKADNWYLRQHPKVLALPFQARTSAARTATIPSMSISPTTIWMFWRTASGRNTSPPNRTR